MNIAARNEIMAQAERGEISSEDAAQQLISLMNPETLARMDAHVDKITLGGRAPVKSVVREDGRTVITLDGPHD